MAEIIACARRTWAYYTTFILENKCDSMGRKFWEMLQNVEKGNVGEVGERTERKVGEIGCCSKEIRSEGNFK